MKAGWKTTEFWITLATLITGAVAPDVPTELVAIAGTYVAGRVVQKSVTANAKAKETVSKGGQ